jgi:hypothetical protein
LKTFSCSPTKKRVNKQVYEKQEVIFTQWVRLLGQRPAAVKKIVSSLPTPARFIRSRDLWSGEDSFLKNGLTFIEPDGEQMELDEIHLRLADRMGLIPPISESLYKAAEKSRPTFASALMEYAVTEPSALKAMPFILGKTLGKAMGSVHLAALWGILQIAPASFYKNVVRAGFKSGPTLGEDIFQQILDHPEGIWAGKVDLENNFAEIKIEDGKINLHIPELLDELQSINVAGEEAALTMPPNSR